MRSPELKDCASGPCLLVEAQANDACVERGVGDHHAMS